MLALATDHHHRAKFSAPRRFDPAAVTSSPPTQLLEETMNRPDTRRMIDAEEEHD